MSDRETIHILDNFSRKEIYNLYKAFFQEVEGNNSFIKYANFTRLWKIELNNVRIPKRSRMVISSIYASIKQISGKSDGIKRGVSLKTVFS